MKNNRETKEINNPLGKLRRGRESPYPVSGGIEGKKTESEPLESLTTEHGKKGVLGSATTEKK